MSVSSKSTIINPKTFVSTFICQSLTACQHICPFLLSLSYHLYNNYFTTHSHSLLVKTSVSPRSLFLSLSPIHSFPSPNICTSSTFGCKSTSYHNHSLRHPHTLSRCIQELLRLFTVRVICMPCFNPLDRFQGRLLYRRRYLPRHIPL